MLVNELPLTEEVPIKLSEVTTANIGDILTSKKREQFLALIVLNMILLDPVDDEAKSTLLDKIKLLKDHAVSPDGRNFLQDPIGGTAAYNLILKYSNKPELFNNLTLPNQEKLDAYIDAIEPYDGLKTKTNLAHIAVITRNYRALLYLRIVDFDLTPASTISTPMDFASEYIEDRSNYVNNLLYYIFELEAPPQTLETWLPALEGHFQTEEAKVVQSPLPFPKPGPPPSPLIADSGAASSPLVADNGGGAPSGPLAPPQRPLDEVHESGPPPPPLPLSNSSSGSAPPSLPSSTSSSAFFSSAESDQPPLPANSFYASRHSLARSDSLISLDEYVEPSSPKSPTRT